MGQVRVGIYDTTVDFWDPATAVARLKKELQLVAASAAGADAYNKAGSGVSPFPRVLLQSKLGGHNCYDTVNDNATKCAFIMDACRVDT